MIQDVLVVGTRPWHLKFTHHACARPVRPPRATALRRSPTRRRRSASCIRDGNGGKKRWIFQPIRVDSGNLKKRLCRQLHICAYRISYCHVVRSGRPRRWLCGSAMGSSYRPYRKRHRLLGQVNHRGTIDLFDLPHVQRLCAASDTVTVRGGQMSLPPGDTFG